MLEKKGITIFLNEESDVDLKDILRVIRQVGENSSWKISDVECFGENAEHLHRISDEEKTISGDEFFGIVSSIHQTIEGTFEAFMQKEISSWCLIRAVDGTEFDIETKDLELLKKIRFSFENVKDLKY